MATIYKSDIIFARIVRQGVTIASLRLSGISSIPELTNYIRHQLEDCFGMVTLYLRNRTQGWQQKRALLLQDARTGSGVQLSLF